jgi:hypothetical protein
MPGMIRAVQRCNEHVPDSACTMWNSELHNAMTRPATYRHQALTSDVKVGSSDNKHSVFRQWLLS